MELTHLRYFIGIMRAGHLTKAARSLGITQPALSVMMRKLEQEVGTPLLHRTGRGVEPTEAGKLFAQHAEAALREADQGTRAVRELLGLERGTIRIGGGATAVAYMLPTVVSTLRAKHPGLRFFVREAGSNQVAASVLSGELDLGLVTLPITIAESDKLVRVPLVHDELRLIAPALNAKWSPAKFEPHQATQALAQSDSFRWKDLVGVPVVGFEAGSAVREVIDHAAAQAHVKLSYVMEVRSIEGIMQMVRAGIGVGFVSKFALAHASAFGAGLACRDASLKRQLAIVRHAEKTLSPAAAACEQELLRAAKQLMK
jgi:DNA-binding transcriptional LysR family regulator